MKSRQGTTGSRTANLRHDDGDPGGHTPYSEKGPLPSRALITRPRSSPGEVKSLDVTLGREEEGVGAVSTWRWFWLPRGTDEDEDGEKEVCVKGFSGVGSE